MCVDRVNFAVSGADVASASRDVRPAETRSHAAAGGGGLGRKFLILLAICAGAFGAISVIYQIKARRDCRERLRMHAR